MLYKQADRGNTLYEQQYLKVGQYLSSQKGHKAVMQEDGNFNLSKDNKVLWSTGTEGKKGKKLIMQEDGNLVLYDLFLTVIWESNTKGKGQRPYKLVMQSDQNLVISDRGNNTIWSTNIKRSQLDRGDTLYEQQYLKLGQFLSTQNGVTATFQEDGNFVIAKDKKIIWQTGTKQKVGKKLIMQQDGNLVLYNAYEEPLWASNTDHKGQPPYKVVLQADNNLVIYSKPNNQTWSSRA